MKYTNINDVFYKYYILNQNNKKNEKNKFKEINKIYKKNIKQNRYLNINDKINETDFFFKIKEKDKINNNKISNKGDMNNKIINKKDNNKKKKSNQSSLDNTIKFSKCSSKVEEEGELGLEEVKDIIIYYNLNNETYKNYLFKNGDFANYIEKGKYKYLNFFMK